MTMQKIGAGAFLFWGLLHIAGAAYILVELLSGGPAAGYAVYGATDTMFASITGSVLGYMSYFILILGIVVSVIAVRLNWRNSETGLAINTGITVATEAGLIIFLLLPGHVSMAEAALGFALFLIGIAAGGLACIRNPSHAR